MSIHAISGKPGGGKSMYSVKLILEELLYGSRVIITNVGLNLPRLNEYLQKEYPARDIDLHTRVRLIDDEEMGVFFTIRPPGSIGPKIVPKRDWDAGKLPDYSGVTDKGVMYVLDEIHIKFNARQWMLTGQDVLFYLSQHRKLGDSVVWITQAINNVDKQFRSVTQDYTFIRNLAKERMSHFSLPSIFLRQTYTSPPTDNSQPMETGSFRMNVKGLASLYDTAKGVSIHGRAGADSGEKKKGMPIWIGIAVIIATVFAAFAFVPKMIAQVFSPQGSVFHDKKTGNEAPSTNSLKQADGIKAELPKTEPENVATVATNEPLTVVASHRMFGRYTVILSDGTEIEEGDIDLRQIHPRKGVLYKGEYLKWAKVSDNNVYYSAPENRERPAELTKRRQVYGPSGKTSVLSN